MRMEERHKKIIELNELLAMDMNVVPEDMRPAFIAKRKGLVE